MTQPGDLGYRLILRAFPREFRRRHGDDMCDQFARQREAARGRPMLAIALWSRAILDAVRHGLALRFARLGVGARRESATSVLQGVWRQSVPRPTECWQALRSTRHSPWYSLTIIVVIALTTSLSATVFAIVDGVLFKPLPYPDVEHLYLATARRPGSTSGGGVFKMDEIASWRDAVPELRVAALQIRANAGTMGDGRMYASVSVDEPFFDVLGHGPLVGGFAREHFQPGGAPVAIISYRLWHRLFGGRTDAMGQRLPLVGVTDKLGRPTEQAIVVGILPRDFVFPAFSNEIPDVIRPLALTAAERSGRNESAVMVLVRRPSAVPIGDLQHRLDAAVRASQQPGTNERPLDGASLRALAELKGVFAKDFRTLTLVAAALVALGCLGVGGLSSARVRQRERDVVLRRALGATTGDLFRQALAEVVPLVFAGAAIGFTLAGVLLELTLSLLPVQTAFVKPPQIDPRVTAVTIALAGFTSLVVALGVVRTARRGRLIAATTTVTGHLRGFGRVIVAGQTGLAFVLTLGGTLVVISLWNIWRVDPGYDRDHIAAVQVSARAPERDTIVETALRANDMLARLPGVEASGVFGARLLQHGWLVATVQTHSEAEPVEMQHVAHGGDLTGVLGMIAVRGRLPTPSEFARRDPVVLISERAASSLWPEENPIGKTLFMSRKAVTVIGVVRDLQFTSLGDFRPRGAGQVHSPDLGYRQMTFLLRTKGRPDLVAGAARAHLVEKRDEFDVLWSGTMADALAGSIAQRRFAAWAYGGFAACALVIASVGIFGLVAMMTGLRTREMAVRLALGAARGGVVRLLLREQLGAVTLGLLGGGLIAWWSVSALSREMFGITAGNPLIWTAAAAVILLTAVGGTLIPAFRAARTDPITTLRVD